MAFPQWITAGDLGIYSETHSFSVQPLVLTYAADAPATISLINGSLPTGLAYAAHSSNVVITGESPGIAVDTASEWTLRITDGHGTVCDRTFMLTLTAVSLPPDWTGQDQFIGYVASGSQGSWTVHAISPQLRPITYTIAQFAPPPGLALDPASGVLTYAAPVVASDSVVSFTLRATTGNVYSDLPCTITVLTVPHLPAWITPQGLIGTVTEGEFVDVSVSAFSSDGSAISYALVSSSPAWPFTLTATGLIYGTMPSLHVDTVYSFVISATNLTGTVQRQFYIIGTPVTVSTALYWSSPTGDLGTVTDGAYVVLDASARSIRGMVTHSLTGGQLPLTLVLQRNEGQLLGFAEYQLRDRSYLFDITATDGVETITRTCSLRVIKGTNAQFAGLLIPLEGPLKDDYYNFIGDTIQPSWYSLPSGTPQAALSDPNITWINGLDYAVDVPSSVVNWANLCINTTELMIGPVTNVNTSPSSTLFYAPILDADAGADREYAQQSGQLANTNNATVTIQTGTITFSAVMDSRGLLDPRTSSIVPGTPLRAVIPGTNDWIQGTVVSISVGGSLVLQGTLTNGSGTSSAWQFFGSPIYPPSLQNVRRDLISGLGWTTGGQGTGAQLLPVIDPALGSISSVTVITPGQGWLYSPSLNIIGQGTGAQLRANLTVVSATVIAAGTAWQVSDTISLDPYGASPALLVVTAVDAQGGLISLGVVAGGDYSRWPAAPQLVTNGQGLPSRIAVSLGIGSVTVLASGTGYVMPGTVIDTAGSEPLPSWQSTWAPYLSIGNVQAQHGGQVYGLYAGQGNSMPTYANLTVTESQLYYKRWPLQHAILALQGINWTGDTTFDGLTTQWDGDLTAFAEWTEPRDTLFDADLELFDQGNTRFDDDFPVWQAAAQRAWGLTEFDQDQTIFDLYRTIFDEATPTTSSITLLRRLLRLISQQITGHDVVV